MATTPDGTHAYVTNVNDGTVTVIDAASNTVIATIPVGHSPNGVAITPDESHSPDHGHQPLAYVTTASDNTVSVVYTANNEVVATIPVGNFPFAVAFATETLSHRNSEQ